MVLKQVDLALKIGVCVLFCFNCWAFRKCGKGENKTDMISDQRVSEYALRLLGFPKNLSGGLRGQNYFHGKLLCIVFTVFTLASCTGSDGETVSTGAQTSPRFLSVRSQF